MKPDAEIVRATYNQLGPAYDRWAASLRRADGSKYEALVKARLPAGASLLEVGCGNGALHTSALSSRFKVVGVDVSERQIREARRNVPEAVFHCGDIRECAFAGGTFDGIVSFYCFNHIARESHPPLCRKLHDWLKPGGLLVASFGCGDTDAWVGEWLGATTFFSGYKPDKTCAILREAGFEIENAVVETADEDGQAVSFLWIVASKAGENSS